MQVCSLLGNKLNQRNELQSIIFAALHTKVSSSTKNVFQNVDIVLKFMTEFDRFVNC